MPNCTECNLDFAITDEDRKFYTKLEVPEPKNCPECRLIRRFNERNPKTLYYRQCDLSGNQTLSQFHKDSKFPVYSPENWWGDDWDGTKYGQNYDFKRPFFEQYEELKNKVPHLALFNTVGTIENSDYNNCTAYLKNCYLIAESDYCEDCYYSNLLKKCTDVVDCSVNYENELCYECVDCQKSQRLFYSQDCESCHDSYFLNNCTSCKNCIGCINQRQKEFMIFNKQYTQEEFEKLKSEMKLDTNEGVKELQKLSSDFFLSQPHKYVIEEQNLNSSGDHLFNSKNAHECFDSVNLEDCRYCQKLSLGVKDSMDFNSWGNKCELIYQCCSVGDNCNNVKFCSNCQSNIVDCEYCAECFSISNCFGCVGLKRKKYCILNKQYTKEEYEELIPKIKEYMMKTGEYGEYFPKHLSPFGYNETMAQDAFPMSKTEALKKGYKWYEDENSPKSSSENALSCDCGKSFKIISQEKTFYEKLNLPEPKKCPFCRHKNRMAKRRPLKLWDRQCDKCSKSINSNYSPKKAENIYCKECFLKEVYLPHIMPTCKNCSIQFHTDEEDKKSLDRLSPIIKDKKYPLPEPTHCPDCRQQRRLANCNEFNLYQTKCGLCEKAILSEHSPTYKRNSYCQKCWHSDNWDPRDYGKEFNFERPFFEQFKELAESAPVVSLLTQGESINCDYIHFAGWSKNSYLIMHADYCEDCMYGYGFKKNTSCVDGFYNLHCELCYDCIDVYKCYGLEGCQDCQTCNSSAFLRDCIGCKDCFLGVGLRNKQYIFKNEQLSKEEYEKKMSEIDLGSQEQYQKYKKELEELEKTHSFKNFNNINTENSFGDHLKNCKNAKFCFDCEDVEDSAYCYQLVLGAKNCMDIYQYGTRLQESYDSAICGEDSYHLLFVNQGHISSQELIYCYNLESSKNCFGCTNMHNMKYCILNKQYTKEEYEELAPKIIEHMKKTGEWGEFFDVKYSMYPYNKTTAQIWYPMTKEQVLEKGWLWDDYETAAPQVEKTLKASELPDNIEEVNEDILDAAIECEETGKLFKITKQELAFYKHNKLPLPRKWWFQRHIDRLNKRNPRKFFKKQCDKCSTDIFTTFDPKKGNKVYCEKCYMAEVY